MKLELVQYPYSKAGPTVYLNDWKIAGPKALGVGKTVYSYELKDADIDMMEKIICVYKKQKGE